MELLDGEPLSQYLRRTGPLSIAEALPLVDQMLAAMDAAHQKCIVHRDFKSTNVMLSDAKRVMVMDFGLARDVSPGSDLKATLASNAFAGTPAYMSRSNSRESAHRSHRISMLWVSFCSKW